MIMIWRRLLVEESCQVVFVRSCPPDSLLILGLSVWFLFQH